MAKQTRTDNPSGSLGTESGRWFSRLPTMERTIFLLRGLALLLVLILHFFDRSTEGVLFPVPQMALVMVGYSGLLFLLMHYVRWLQRPLNYLAVDTVVTTLAVYLTGGYHSSFFVQFVFITIGAAFQLELVATVIVTLGIGLIYVAACYVNPAGLQRPYALYILAAKLLGLMITGVLCALLLEQLRREHRETERERVLAQRLKALNDLFQQLNTSLDFGVTLQTVAEAPKALLGADRTSIALLDEGGRYLSVAAAAGMDLAPLAGQQWPASGELLSAILTAGQPCAMDKPAEYLKALPALLAGAEASASIASVVSVPLLLDEQPLGVLDVAYGKPRAFSTEDLAFLRGLGHEAALAIRNARLYERERDQVSRLRALDKAQRGFVSTVSHELRTPLTCIKTSVDLLGAMSDGLSDAQLDLIRTMEHHLGHLEALVADLLEITRLEAGQVTLAKQPSDLRLLVSRVVDALRPLTERKRQTVHLHWADSLTPVDVDRRRVEQALTNILSNAYKFTPKQGRIDVHITETLDGARVCVTDNGPGIPEKDQAHVFDKFYVVADGRGLSGLGLGLYIARHLIELHGGRIWVESRLATGSTFCFTLPRTAEERGP